MTGPSSNCAALDQRERGWRFVLALAWPIGLALAIIIVANEIPLCGFATLTGHPCPFCGGTRACAALAVLDISKAWLHSPGIVIAVVFAATHTGFLLMEAVVGRRLGWHCPWLVGWKTIGCIIAVAWCARLTGG